MLYFSFRFLYCLNSFLKKRYRVTNMQMLLYITAILFIFGFASFLLRILNTHSYLFAALTFGTAWGTATLAPATLQSPFPTAVSIFYICINLYTFLLYAIDKRAAIKNKWRIPERQLHLFMFAGGVLAAIAGQKLFRHKTRKLSFRIVFWILLVVQVCIPVWLVAERWM